MSQKKLKIDSAALQRLREQLNYEGPAGLSPAAKTGELLRFMSATPALLSVSPLSEGHLLVLGRALRMADVLSPPYCLVVSGAHVWRIMTEADRSASDTLERARVELPYIGELEVVFDPTTLPYSYERRTMRIISLPARKTPERQTPTERLALLARAREVIAQAADRQNGNIDATTSASKTGDQIECSDADPLRAPIDAGE